MRTTFDQLWAGVLEDPRDPAPQLVLADYLDETGADPPLAAGLRWCAAHGKWPYHYPHHNNHEHCWFYVDPDLRGQHEGVRYRLPEAVWWAVGGKFDHGPDARDPVRRVGEFLLTCDSQLSSMTPEGITRTGET